MTRLPDSYRAACNNEFSMSCALCATRKEKRFCPAIHDRICPVCCGTEREVTLACPSECIYLQQARKHEKPRELTDAERALLFPEVEINEAFFQERGPFLSFLNHALANFVLAHGGITDRELIEGLSAAASSYHTLVKSGLHYAASSPGMMQQALVSELDKMIEGYREGEAKNRGYSTLRESDVRDALVMMLRVAYARTSGRPKSRAFIDVLTGPYAQKQSALLAPDDSERRIVLP
jgi:hypothetical protein